MASEETMTIHLSINHTDDDDDDVGAARLSRLSIESSDGEADAELSDNKEDKGSTEEDDSNSNSNSDSVGFASLPGTPRLGMRCRKTGRPMWLKEYASENEAAGPVRKKNRSSRIINCSSRRSRLDRAWEMKKHRVMEEEGIGILQDSSSPRREESKGCRVFVRPRREDKCICMDMEEVKACKDLGLELPCHWTVQIPGWFSGSTVDTSSGGNSPTANWRISSPGDDPKDVKARLKAWAQAVALASSASLP